MPTAVAKTKAVAAPKEVKIVTAEERTRIKQERARLTQELEHCQENFDIAAAALEAAADPDKDPDEYMLCHRDYTILRKKLAAKQAEIAEHRQTFLSDEEIEKRDREEQEAKEEAAREEARLKIAKPLQQQMLKAFDDLLAADKVFRDVYGMLNRTQPGRSPLHNSSEVAALANTILRNWRAPVDLDPPSKRWNWMVDGGRGEDRIRAIIKSCA